ncbi:HAD-IA family hydrolase [Streptomyces sp. BR123]|uniref:HAD family hydrolase n=1 Tax=Streptomyces sp. BR123 TaxID=2749828 RepID=UPI0015C4A31D|nr:HAD-IA family hydrolase [Streptomyces sp. BR123]NXY93761.1 HAD-IA family hydrolase [Streptomyces sp. BR123]
MTDDPIADAPFDALLCDFDNVIRFYDPGLLPELERRAGLAAGTTAQVAFAPGRDLPLLLGEITKRQWVESIVLGLTECVPEPVARELGTAFAELPFRADEAVVALLRRVRAHMPLVLVTNATEELEADLVTLGLADLAHHVVSSARVGVAKPDRRIYEIAAERAGVAVQRCLFVDDRAENVEAAVAIGMTGVHYRELADLSAVLGFLPPG